MIETLIKRDGSTEPFTPSKVNGWGIWAAENLKDRVDWSDVVCQAVADSPKVVNSQDLQDKLIQICVDKGTWPYSLMAGKLYAVRHSKQLYGKKIPTVKELFVKLENLGLMKHLDYTDEDYEVVEQMIDHKRDQNLAQFQIKQIRKKYSIENRQTGQEYETPQFTYMRMALALAETEPRQTRLKDIKAWYDHFSFGRINAPTPNYVNLGTKHNGYASCCLIKAGDSLPSLAIHDHIAYVMTGMSAGIGSYIETRTIGDDIRSGNILHQGKLPYYQALAKGVKANIQAGRGGACTSYYSCFDPQAITIAQLQNPKQVEDIRNRDIHFATMCNRLLAKKVAQNKDIFSFTTYSAPDLTELFFSGDQDGFEALYEKYENDSNFKKNYTSARDFVVLIMQQAHEVSTNYLAFMDEINRHTPFKETVHSSNLCVAPETKILTDRGHLTISDLVDQSVNVWNGSEFSSVKVVKTSDSSSLLTVKTDCGMEGDFTPHHKFYVIDDYHKNPREVRAAELKAGDKLMKGLYPIIEGVEKLENNDLNKSEFFVPNTVYTIKSRLDWLGRMVDSNGSIEDDQGDQSLVISSTNHEFLINTQLMLQTHGCESKIKLQEEAGSRLLPKNDGTGQKEIYECKTSYRLLIASNELQSLFMQGLMFKRLKVVEHNPQRSSLHFIKVESVTDNGRIDKTYCFTEPKKNLGVFNGILAGNCTEITEPTIAYQSMLDLYSEQDHGKGETAICSLGALVPDAIENDDIYADAAYYTYKMIDKCIHITDYPLPHIGYTAKRRLNAAVGIVGMATCLARKGLKYSSKEGKEEIHRISERHAYFCIRASLRLGQELGNAPWMHKTKWPEGWLPIDTYKKTIDNIVNIPLTYDWENLRRDIISNGGIRNSCVIAHMPTESSSKASGRPKGLYPIDMISGAKSDDSNLIDWCAIDGDLLSDAYQLAYDIPTIDMIDCYGVVQKFTDQAISADLFEDRVRNPNLSNEKLISEFLHMVRVGMKTRYYQRSKTTEGKTKTAETCASGACDV